MPGITLDNVQEKLWDGEATNSSSMGSNFYTRALRGAPLSVPTGNTHAPDRMTDFNPGPWNPHLGLSIWCVPGKRFATYYAIFLSENMWQYRKEWMEMWFVSRWHQSQMIWHKTGMSQHCHLTHPHAITCLCKYVSNNIMLSETYFPLMCMK